MDNKNNFPVSNKKKEKNMKYLILPSERKGKFSKNELKFYASEIEHNEPIPIKYSKPTKYFKKVKPRVAEISQWYADGMSYKDIANNLGIGTTTFFNYLTTYSELRNAIENADKLRKVAIEHSTLQSALGFTKTIRKPIKIKEQGKDEFGNAYTVEKVVYADEEIYIPPNAITQQFLLKNYMPEKYKDKVEQEVKVNVTADNISSLSTEALMNVMASCKDKSEIIDVDFTEITD